MKAFPGKALFVSKELYRYYFESRIPRAAAALSYYLTMTFFPMIICLYTLLGRNYGHAVRAVNFLSQYISPKTTDMLRSFMKYVAQSNRESMLFAGLVLLITSASAAERTLQITIGEMQGKRRYKGLGSFFFSLISSLLFVAAIYFAIVVLLTSRELLDRLNALIPFIDIGSSWQWFRFLLLAGICLVMFALIYRTSQARGEYYRCFPGAVFSTLAIEGMSLVFSRFIAASTRYSLVYGSLSSVILLMIWLYFNCQIIYLGAALNLALRSLKEHRAVEEQGGHGS